MKIYNVYKYYTTIRESKDPKYIRLRMVQDAREYGISETARRYCTTRKTIRKWLNRYDRTLNSLEDRSRAPRNPPKRLSPQDEARIVELKKQLRPWGARRLKMDFNLPYSVKTIRKVIKKYDLARKWRRKKHETKRCLREIKRKWRAFQQICVDTKDLKDIPEYWIQKQMLGLPAYQYTARDACTGSLFIAFADELSLTYSRLFIERVLRHLKDRGIDCSKVTIQTDNGSEFIGSWQAKNLSEVTKTIESFGAVHKTIPPGAYKLQSDVETVHSIMENEFYIEEFNSKEEFLRKAEGYMIFFNYVRRNSGKENRCPFELLKEKIPAVSFDLLYLPPDALDEVFHELFLATHPKVSHHGYHVGYHPYYSHRVIVEENRIEAHSERARDFCYFNYGAEYCIAARNTIGPMQINNDCEGLAFHLWPAKWVKPKVEQISPLRYKIIDPEGEVRREELVGGVLQVVDGAGIGQIRTVIAREGDEVVIDEPFRYPPDSQSTIAFAVPPPFRGMTLVDNTIVHTGANILLWGDAHDVVIDGNICMDNGHISVWSVRSFEAQKVWGGASFMQVIHNKSEIAWIKPKQKEDAANYFGAGIGNPCCRDEKFTGSVGFDFLGLIIRDNACINQSGIVYRTRYDSVNNLWKLHDAGIVVERNYSEDGQIGVAVDVDAPAVVRKNRYKNVCWPVIRFNTAKPS